MGIRFVLVRVTGLEPAHLSALEPKSNVSASFTTPAHIKLPVRFHLRTVTGNKCTEVSQPKSIVSANFTTSAGNAFSIPRFSGFVKHVHQFFPKRHPKDRQANQTNGQKASEITCVSPCLLQLQPPDKQEQNQTNRL